MSEDTADVTETEEDEELAEEEEAPASQPLASVDVEDLKTRALGSSIKLKPVKGDVDVDFTTTERATLKPRKSRGGKVFTDGFSIPGFSGYTDVPGKMCVDCGFRAMRFSTSCSKCGGELVPEPEGE